MTPLARLALAVPAFLVVPACGHRGDPLPPLRRTPPPLVDFRLAQRGDALEISCRAPRASVDGVAYEEIAVEFLWAEGRADLEKAGRKRTVRATGGARVVEPLPLPAGGTLVRAAARASAGGGPGPRTLILSLVAQPPLEAPGDLSARLVEEGVVLEWKGTLPEPVPPPDLASLAGAPALPFGPPRRPILERPAGGRTAPEPDAPRDRTVEGLAGGATAPGGKAPAAASDRAPSSAVPSAEPPAEPGGASGTGAAPPLPHGFHVYRRIEPAVYGPPLGEDPLSQRIFTDAQPPLDATVCYVIRAVGSVQPLIESGPSNEVCLPVRDVVPPRPLAGVAVLPREEGLEVVWSPSPELDVVGYRVYRRTGEDDPARVAEVPTGTTSWLDTSAAPGPLYSYTVAAVDQAGNESAPSGSAEGRHR